MVHRSRLPSRRGRSRAGVAGIDFVPTDQIEAAAQDAGLSEAETTALVGDYQDAQIQSLKLGLLLAAFLALGSLAFTRDLPRTIPSDDEELTDAVAPA